MNRVGSHVVEATYASFTLIGLQCHNCCMLTAKCQDSVNSLGCCNASRGLIELTLMGITGMHMKNLAAISLAIFAW